MPAKSGRDEQIFIRRFVSAYENFTWAGSKIDALDEAEDGAIDALVTRADGRTIAIEHTLIEPFVGDKSDFAMFEKPFLRIKDYKSLAVPDAAITVYVPVGILDGQKPAKRTVIVESIRSWIANNRLHLREGEHGYQCDIPGMPPVTLTVKRHKLGLPHPNPGTISVGRQQVKNDLDKVIERALQKKVPKLANTKADRHLLLLERDQFNFFPDLIFAEIEHQRANFSLLESVDEIWHVETIGYRRGGYVDFELWKVGKVLESMAFENGELYARSRHGMPCPI
ncbi:MAG: hypothetical protein WBD10_00975 [Acidobacteriaceae bacterium]